MAFRRYVETASMVGWSNISEGASGFAMASPRDNRLRSWTAINESIPRSANRTCRIGGSFRSLRKTAITSRRTKSRMACVRSAAGMARMSRRETSAAA